MTSGGYTVEVLANGVPLSEQADGVIAVPFGAEYVLRFSTTTGRRATVKVTIDGNDVTDGGELIVPASGYSELKRPTSNGNEYAFKFASTESAAAANAGKQGADTDGTKGLIVCEFMREKYIAPPVAVRRGQSRGLELNAGDYERSRNVGGSSTMSFGPSYSPPNMGVPTADSLSSGVTVEGAKTNQTFQTVYMDTEGPPVVVQVKLKGYNAGVAAAQAPASTQGTNCPYCLHRLSPLSNRCPNCGKQVR